MVSSCAIDDGIRLLLFDPLAVPDEILKLAHDREPVIVLTAPWHERDTMSLVERLDAPVFAPLPDTAADLIRKFGATPEQAAGGSPDIAWLLADEAHVSHLYAAGSGLPIGVEAFLGRESNDLVLWIEAAGTVISGDTLVDFGRGLQVNDWLREDVTHDEVVQRLRPLLDLPIEMVILTHGAPTDRAALVRALS